MPSLSTFYEALRPEHITIALLILAIITLALWVFRLEWRIKKMLHGGKVDTIEQALTALSDGHSDFRTFEKSMEAYLEGVESRLRKSVQRIETIRFNPFKGNGDGGNQSFATAFINEEGDGTIVSSIYTRDRMSIFSKPVSKFASSYELSQEEKQVLENVRNSFSRKP